MDLVQAAAIRRAVPDARLVGVFGDHTPAAVLAAVAAVDLDLVQLHGQQSPAVGAGIAQAAGVPAIRALTPAQVDDRTCERYQGTAYFLIDSAEGLDVVAARNDVLAAAIKLTGHGGRVLIAGGLGPDDVAAALAEAHPFGVDVCRGVESEPGRKDLRKLVTFMRKAGR